MNNHQHKLWLILTILFSVLLTTINSTESGNKTDKTEDSKKRILEELKIQHQQALDYETKGLLDEALELYTKVYNERKEILGREHRDTLTTRNNIGTVINAQGKYEEALKIFLDILPLEIKALGINHQNVLNTKNNLASVYFSQANYQGAFNIYEDVLENQKKLMGAFHPGLVKTKSNLAATLKLLGRPAESLAVYNEVLAKQEEIYQDIDDPQILITKINIGSVYRDLQQYKKAHKLFTDVLEEYEENFGANHAETLNIHRNVGMVLEEMGRTKEALEAFQIVLQGQVKNLGREHPTTKETKDIVNKLHYKIHLQNKGQIDKESPQQRDEM